VGGGLSHGTATTMVENLASGGAVRRDGRIVSVPAAFRTRRVDFGQGPVAVTTIPWGDVSTAFLSTGIPDVEVYTRVSAFARRMMVASRYLGWLLGSGPVQRVLKGRIDAAAPGPTDEERARGKSLLWGEAEDDAGGRAGARMLAPQGYTLTAVTAVGAAEEVLAGRARPGFSTPSLAFGPDWVLGFDGVTREDLP